MSMPFPLLPCLTHPCRWPAAPGRRHSISLAGARALSEVILLGKQAVTKQRLLCHMANRADLKRQGRRDQIVFRRRGIDSRHTLNRDAYENDNRKLTTCDDLILTTSEQN